MPAFKFRSATRGERPYLVLLHTAEVPADDEWSAYVDALSHTLALARGRVHAFVATDGGGPNAAQRQRLAHAMTRGDAITHIFTTDVVPRGILTAFRWVSRAQAAAYVPRDFPSVCEMCGLQASDVLQDFRLSASDFPEVKTLAMLERAVRETPQGNVVRLRGQ